MCARMHVACVCDGARKAVNGLMGGIEDASREEGAVRHTERRSYL